MQHALAVLVVSGVLAATTPILSKPVEHTAPPSECQAPIVTVTVRCPCTNCSGGADGGTGGGTDAGTPRPDGGSPGGAGIRLNTKGNAIVQADGGRWQGRGANLMDTRSCNACAYNSPDKGAVMRRAAELIGWGATYLRLDLESYAQADGRVHWQSVVNDPAYLQDVVDIVRHISSKGVYVEVSLWVDPSIGPEGRPTAQTTATWRVLAQALLHEPRAIFGVVNEPEGNYDGANDAAVWKAMNDVVAGIRAIEDAARVPYHLVAVQGTRGWARVLDYYITHPITAGGGKNVVYETHVYNPASDFASLVTTPAQTLPIIIGEFGPFPDMMTLQDTQQLITLADSLKVPWTAWTFHGRCSPNLLVDHSNGGCGIGMQLAPTEWGTQIRTALGGQ